MKIERGITLIALIITIILMLILTGVVISLTIGENGLINTAKYAVQKNSEAEAKEKLELALANLQANKYTDDAYNENEYIDDYLNNENIEILGNTATIGNWDFEIDRSVPTIKGSLGKSNIKLTKEVKEYLGKNENDKYMVSVLVKIESNQKLESIDFENLDGTILTVVPEKEIITKDMQIELDKEYKIVLKMAEGKIQTRTIMERSVENIRTAEELAEFRDKANSGLTYEGKTINLVNNIDLSSVCGANVNGQEVSWEPIGNYGTDNTHIFKGTFDGNYHTITNLYYNSNKYNIVGLFSQNNGTIQNLILDNVDINAYGMKLVVGGISGSGGTIINCGVNSGSITSSGSEYIMTGGISGRVSKIINCYNKANITSYSNNSGAYAGGIAGTYAKVENCYNIGAINSSSGEISISGGIVAEQDVSPNYVKNSYNTGAVNANGTIGTSIGGIIGRNGWSGSYPGVSVTNSYCTTETAYLYAGYTSSIANIIEKETLKTYAQTLGQEYVNDDSNINNGYPILKWQLEVK